MSTKNIFILIGILAAVAAFAFFAKKRKDEAAAAPAPTPTTAPTVDLPAPPPPVTVRPKDIIPTKLAGATARASEPVTRSTTTPTTSIIAFS